MSRTVPCLLGLALLVATDRATAEPGDHPYVYHRLGAVPAGIRLDAETAFGTREVRPFGEHGLEQAVRGRVGLTPWLAGELRGGLALQGSEDVAGGAMAALEALVVDPDALPFGLAVAAGGGIDTRGDAVLRGQLAIETPRRAFHAALFGVFELPLAEDRDTVDLILGLAASVAALESVRLGLELLAEDLEGFWEEEEAEGGARLLGGPTACLTFAERWDVRASLGGVLAFGPLGGAPEAGLLARVGIGHSF